MKAKTIMLILSNLLIGVFLSNAQEISNITIDTSNLYFPNHLLIDTVNLWGREKDDEFYQKRMQGNWHKNSMCSEQLLRLKEPILHQEYPHEVYRFTWFGFFGNKHNPFTIRIENYNENVFIISKYISRDKNKEGLFVNDTVFVDKKSWLEFKSTLENANFWDISPIEKTDIVVMDGATWILEGKKNDLYHVVFRVSGKNKEIGNICLHLLQLSNMKLKRKQFY